MAANTNAIFPNGANVGWTNIATGNNTYTGTTGTIGTIFTAAANGSRLDTIKVRALGTNIQTVLRIFINNGGSTETPSNNTLYYEITIAASSAASNGITGTDVEIPMDIILPSGYTVFVVTGVTISAGLQVTAVGGNY